MSKFSIILPVYNEEELIQNTYTRLKTVMESIKGDYELIFINDGSTDNSSEVVKQICKNDSHVKLLDFSRNFGHQVAISAGIDHAEGDAAVILDADLQDPPEVIPHMIKKWEEGYEVIYGKRIKREGETAFKKVTAHIYYRLLKYITNFNIPVDSGDFRLIDKKVYGVIKSFHEKSRYIRGLISWIGFKQTYVEYVRGERTAGVSKFPLKKMLKFAIDGITSFSIRPLRLAMYLGFANSGLAFLYIFYALYQRFFNSRTVIGWTSLIAANAFFNGIILIILGIMGEYVGRIYEETKNRPLYILKDKVGIK